MADGRGGGEELPRSAHRINIDKRKEVRDICWLGRTEDSEGRAVYKKCKKERKRKKRENQE